jgi:hypothetical protein
MNGSLFRWSKAVRKRLRDERPAAVPLDRLALFEELRARHGGDVDYSPDLVIHLLQKDVAFERFACKDAEARLEAQRLLNDELRAQNERLAKLAEAGEAHRKRADDHQRLLFESVRECDALKKRLTDQAKALSDAYEARLRGARDRAMEELNRHYLEMVQQGATAESAAEHVDAMRACVALHLV